jgi:hypothetical protein
MNLSSRWLWIGTNAAVCTVVSLIAAAATSNKHWALNIPISLVVGGLIGWSAYGLNARLRRRNERIQREREMRRTYG